MSKQVQIGSVSTGTMLEEDLVPCFEYELRNYGVRVLDNSSLDELFDALDNLAPAFCYFGSHPGDDADYGFWIDQDNIEAAVYDGEIIKLSDVPDFGNTDEDVWQGAEYALVVNDHGNMSLYNRGGEEIWSVV